MHTSSKRLISEKLTENSKYCKCYRTFRFLACFYVVYFHSVYCKLYILTCSPLICVCVFYIFYFISFLLVTDVTATFAVLPRQLCSVSLHCVQKKTPTYIPLHNFF